MRRATVNCMDLDGRKFSAFSTNSLPFQPQLSTDRFVDVDQAPMSQRLGRLAEVRSRVVARGRVLIANASYPDRRIARAVARLLAVHLAH